LRSPQPMEEAPVHRPAIQRSQSSAIRIRQNGLTAKLRRYRAKTRSDLVESLAPGNSPPDRRSDLCGDSGPTLSSLCGAGAPAREGPFRADSPHRIHHTIRRIHPIQILRHLRAQKPARHWMLRIPLDLSSSPVLDGDQHPASVRTIMRTSRAHHSLHRVRL